MVRICHCICHDHNGDLAYGRLNCTNEGCGCICHEPFDEDQGILHRLAVLESQMENVHARLDGHDLGFATLGLTEEGRKSLAKLIGP